MSNKRKEIPELGMKVTSGHKKYVRYREGAELFSMGERTFMDLAKESGAVRKIKGVCLVNVDMLGKYIEDMYA